LIKTAQDAEAPLRNVEMVAAVNDTRKCGIPRKVLRRSAVHQHVAHGSMR
jgi:hypothetical protein